MSKPTDLSSLLRELYNEFDEQFTFSFDVKDVYIVTIENNTIDPVSMSIFKKYAEILSIKAENDNLVITLGDKE